MMCQMVSVVFLNYQLAFIYKYMCRLISFLLQPLLDEVNCLADSYAEMDCQTVVDSANYIYDRVVDNI